MVKKSTILDKLKSRLRSTDVQVESRSTTVNRPSAGPASANRVSPAAPEAAAPEPAPIARPVAEQASNRKLSKQEEASLAMKDGFQELTSLLRGMQTRVEAQGERFTNAADNLARLPELNQTQVDLMKVIADRLESQNQTNEVLVRSFGDLPELMSGVREALDRAAATDERTAETLDEFRSNMGRIQSSMERMVDHSAQQAQAASRLADGQKEHVDELAGTLQRGQSVTAERIEQSHDRGVKTLRDAGADQTNRLGKLIEDGTKTNRAILIMLGLVFVALVVVAGLLATS